MIQRAEKLISKTISLCSKRTLNWLCHTSKSGRAHVGNTPTFNQPGPIRALVFRRVATQRPVSPTALSLAPVARQPAIAHTAPPFPPASCCQSCWAGTVRGEPCNPAAEMFVYGDLGKAAKSALMCGSCCVLRSVGGRVLRGLRACRRCGFFPASAVQCEWRSGFTLVVCTCEGALNRPVTLMEPARALILTVAC